MIGFVWIEKDDEKMSEIFLVRYWMNGYIRRERENIGGVILRGENNVFSLRHTEFEMSIEYPSEECPTVSWI